MGTKSDLINAIGIPAMLEQTAEEANELAFACLKMARFLRGENKVHNRTKESLEKNLNEEIADIVICIEEMLKGLVVDGESIDKIVDYKRDRMSRRLMEEI
jgi:NTP pyrophosphatase (non-canonical NTP hydrolase)